MTDLLIGQTIETADGRQGIIRFLGSTHFAAGAWVGVELDDAVGKNNGSVQGQQYFECDSNRGLFLRPEGVAQILDQPTPRHPVKVNGNTANGHARGPRPSSGLPGDAARKRQSLMNGASTPSSRLSMRSPTKSPTKALSPAASSTGSTPRTGTPSTTARISSSSTKSRTNAGPRKSMAPPKAPSKPTVAPSGNTRQSLTNALERRPRPSLRPTNTPGGRVAASPIGSGATEPTSSNHERGSDAGESLPKDETGALDDTPAEHSRSDPMLTSQGHLEPADAKPLRKPTSQPAATVTELRRENEQLKAKMVVMEKNMKKNRDENDKLKKDIEDKARYEMTTQKLQEKARQQHQEMSGLKESLKKAQEAREALEAAHANDGIERDCLIEEKLLAEDDLRIATRKLDDLERKEADMQEEIDILRQENEEFNQADSNPEERQSVNFLHLERENLRLREALGRLKEKADEMEEESKLHIDELQLELGDLESVRSEFNATKAILLDTEAAKQALKEQVDAMDSAAEETQILFERIEEKSAEVARLTHELEDSRLVEEANEQIARQYEDEIQQFNEELESRIEMLNDSFRAQDRLKREIQEREHLLQAFKGLLSEYQEKDGVLRDPGNIDSDSDELSKKSRELLELNLKLQNTTAKSQNSLIDTELNRLKGEESSEHLSILKLFLPSTFEVDRNPILALFTFKRILFKGKLLRSLLRENMESAALSATHDGPLIFDIIEKLVRVSAACDRFVTYINSCAADEFLVFEGAGLEVEPVERNMNVWIEQLKGGDWNLARCSTELSGALAIFTDLSEKLLPRTAEMRSHTMSTYASLVSIFFDHLSLELGELKQSLSTTLLPSSFDDGDGELDILLRQLEQLISRAKVVRTVVEKALKNLNELSSRCLVLGEDPELDFEKAEELAQEILRFVCRLTTDLRLRIEDESQTEALTLSTALDVLSASSKSFLQSSAISGLLPAAPEDFAASLTQCLSLSSKKVETLAAEAGDHNLTSEFERNAHPWILRAQAVKAEKTIAPETEEMINNLRSGYERQSQTLVEKDTTLEQQRLRIELLESRTKDSKEQAAIVRGLESEISRARRERDDTQNAYEVAKAECLRIQEERATLEAQIKELQLNSKRTGPGSAEGVGIMSIKDQKALQDARNELAALKTETTDLQAAVRYLREQNRRARLPVYADSAAQHAWLSMPLVPKPSDRGEERVRGMAEDCESLIDHLREVAREMKPVVLRPERPSIRGNKQGQVGTLKTWRPQRTSPKYQLLRRKEDLAQWQGAVDDLLGSCEGQVGPRPPRPRRQRTSGPIYTKPGPEQEIQIVGSPPRS